MPTVDALLRVIDVHGEIAELGLDLGGVMNFVVRKVIELTDADGAAIELVTDDAMVYRAVAGIASNQLGARVSLNGSLSGACLRLGHTLVCDDSETDLRVDREACRRVGLRSMVVVPLMHEGLHVGVLKAMSRQPDRFGPAQSEVLDLLTRVVGTSMYWATRYGGDDLFHKATHDAMTDLANRSLFMDRLRHAVALGRRRESLVALLVLDMDGLKAVNDTLGHAAGDAALIEFSRRLVATARASDTVARLGGDEFALLLSPVQSLDEMRGLQVRLADRLLAPFAVDGTPVSLAASCGHALCPDDADEAASLVDCADRRMYEAKRINRARRVFAARNRRDPVP